ncbi:RNA-directed DNA polymerase (reverse transcriptase)-related family protein [Rhynchospora pubera]|uniref:RNA-directed DNA polymerase (Reverse transcriptase)-related family protein n=1 Tax=Rhynchospora pubera TaxID=906938 RepID=A0AAV8FZ50_9POAL|nr:RNA-directed DNA polymerase (reverse transcriptase)-related family protein [Rhynchospora pubera]
MACVKSARFAILFDGKSDGFIVPTSGLRQGCALSPYLFIMCMDVLTRMLMHDTHNGRLKGVRLSRNGPTLNTLLYADDLLIFGEASMEEVRHIVSVLDQFCVMSGQQIGHSKSKVWFSNSTPQTMKNYVLQALNATLANPSEVYLGSPAIARTPRHFQPLVNKIECKLQGWKATFLSQAGKITLIKSVIEPMLLHAMSTSSVPKETLARIQSKVTTFFWSSKEQRKMPMIAWRKITKPKMCGGLGLRDFHCLNKAFNLKCLWKLATNSSALWVQIAKAKYLRNESVWSSTRRSRCTTLWKALMDARQNIQQHIVWQLGDGTKCQAFGQPWHGLWHLTSPSSSRQNNLLVSDLVNPVGGWNNEKLIHEFGFATALYIVISAKPPQVQSSREDRIIFSYAKNGQFSLRKAYQLVAEVSTSPDLYPALLKAIWQTKGVLPRVRLFLWKTMHNSLPLGDVIGRRISNATRPCSLCGYHAETLPHALFKCPWARSLWLTSALGLRTDELNENVSSILMAIFGGVDENRARLVANHLWALWKLRCTEVFGGKKATPNHFLALANSYDRLEILAGLTSGWDGGTNIQQVQVDSITCVIDGSFCQPDKAGWAYLLSDESGSMLEYGMQAGPLFSPLHAEIKAMLLAANMVIKRGFQNCTFATDCANLNMVLNNTLQADQLDWRVYHDLLDVIYIFRINPGFTSMYVPREQIATVDRLAKFARVNSLNYEGYTYPIIHECNM